MDYAANGRCLARHHPFAYSNKLPWGGTFSYKDGPLTVTGKRLDGPAPSFTEVEEISGKPEFMGDISWAEAHGSALNIGSLLSESAESVAYKQDPGRGKEGIHDYDQTEARQRSDPKDAGGQGQIGRDLVEHSP